MEETPGQEPNHVTPPAGETTESQTTEAKTYSEDYVKRLRTEAANYRTRANALEEAEKERQKAQMSETERLKAELDEARSKARTLEVRTLRMEAASRHGLSAEDIEFLTGEDEKTIFAQAEKLAARLKASAPASKGEEKPAATLPPSGSRTPPSSNPERAAIDSQLASLQSRIPALRGRQLNSA